MALIKLRQFPSWALFCYKELTAQANNLTPPDILCVQSSTAIILAPSIQDNTVTGLLIATEEASATIQDMYTESGKMLKVQLPVINTKVVAQDAVTLTILAGSSSLLSQMV